MVARLMPRARCTKQQKGHYQSLRARPNWPLVIFWTNSTPATTRRALKKHLNPSIGATRALMRPCSCSTTSFKWGHVRIWTAPSRTVVKFVVHAHPTQSGMRGLETVQSNHPWVAVTAKRPPEKRLGGGDVAGTAPGRIRRFCRAYPRHGTGKPIGHAP